MNSAVMKNTNGENVSIEVIRFFINNDIEYLIYSLNEIDEAGYTKLYASKIIGNRACIIIDEDEWHLVREIIKQTVKNNRDGNALDIIDLDEDRLQDIILVDTRKFKLQGNLVNLLSENKNVINHVSSEIKEDIEIHVADEEIESEDENNNIESVINNSIDTELKIEPVESTSINFYEQNNDLNESVDYEQLYNELLNKNKELESEIISLKKYEELIEKIKEIVDN